MALRRYTLDVTRENSKVLSIREFPARWISIHNPTPSRIGLRIGGTDIPTATNNDYIVQSGATLTVPVNTSELALAVLDPALTSNLSNTTISSIATLTLGSEVETPPDNRSQLWNWPNLQLLHRFIMMPTGPNALRANIPTRPWSQVLIVLTPASNDNTAWAEPGFLLCRPAYDKIELSPEFKQLPNMSTELSGNAYAYYPGIQSLVISRPITADWLTVSWATIQGERTADSITWPGTTIGYCEIYGSPHPLSTIEPYLTYAPPIAGTYTLSTALTAQTPTRTIPLPYLGLSQIDCTLHIRPQGAGVANVYIGAAHFLAQQRLPLHIYTRQGTETRIGLSLRPASGYFCGPPFTYNGLPNLQRCGYLYLLSQNSAVDVSVDIRIQPHQHPTTLYPIQESTFVDHRTLVLPNATWTMHSEPVLTPAFLCALSGALRTSTMRTFHIGLGNTTGVLRYLRLGLSWQGGESLYNPPIYISPATPYVWMYQEDSAPVIADIELRWLRASTPEP